jgi:hypothetical protein
LFPKGGKTDSVSINFSSGFILLLTVMRNKNKEKMTLEKEHAKFYYVHIPLSRLNLAFPGLFLTAVLLVFMNMGFAWCYFIVICVISAYFFNMENGVVFGYNYPVSQFSPR